jgi:hypothetical protein
VDSARQRGICSHPARPGEETLRRGPAHVLVVVQAMCDAHWRRASHEQQEVQPNLISYVPPSSNFPPSWRRRKNASSSVSTRMSETPKQEEAPLTGVTILLEVRSVPVVDQLFEEVVLGLTSVEAHIFPVESASETGRSGVKQASSASLPKLCDSNRTVLLVANLDSWVLGVVRRKPIAHHADLSKRSNDCCMSQSDRR